MPEASGDFELITTGAGFTTMLAAVLAVPPAESVTTAPKVELPGVVGVPEMIPLPNDKPSGSAPEIRLQVYGGLPPIAESEFE
jgi:hypothetical protein